MTRFEEDGPSDLDGSIVDGLEALRQRIEQAIRFRLGTWFLAVNRGLPDVGVIGYTSVDLAVETINDEIRLEGGDELTGIHDVAASLDQETRVLTYRARLSTIYGDMTISEAV